MKMETEKEFERELLRGYLQQNVLCTAQVTEEYGISKQMLSHYVKKGAIVPIRELPLGNLYSRTDIENLMQQKGKLGKERAAEQKILADQEGGHAGKCLKFFQDNRNFLSAIVSVTIYATPLDAILYGSYRKAEDEKIGDFYGLETPSMVIRDADGKEIWLSGCNCGYGGKGPKSSKEILCGLGVSTTDAEKVFYNEVLSYSRRADGGWSVIVHKGKDSPAEISKYRSYSRINVVQRGETLIVLVTEDARTILGAGPVDQFLVPYSQFIPDPITATIMTRKQAVKAGHFIFHLYNIGSTKIYNLVIKDSSGRELWLEIDPYSIVSASTQHTMLELLQYCGFTLGEEETNYLPENIKQWLSLMPISKGTNNNR